MTRDAAGRFAGRVFLAAALFGLVVLPPLYFLESVLGRVVPPEITHPEFYYGFVGVTLAGQVVYLLIAHDPRRYRPFMLVAMLAKGSFVATVLVLVLNGRLGPAPAAIMLVDLVFVVLFAWAYARTGEVGPNSI